MIHIFLNRLLKNYGVSMNTLSRFAQEPGPEHSGLSIGDLAERTGLSPATIRAWEQRHGFPVPARLDSGHRRYGEAAVGTVMAVLRRREAGVRLDVAIAEATRDTSDAAPGSPSVFATLRTNQPHLATHRLKKSTLLALSWAIEDEFCARADRAHIFGAFQTTAYWQRASDRWAELARVSSSAFVFADFDAPSAEHRPVLVPLSDDAPMRREWVVVCDSADLPVALTAWEVPLARRVRDGDRIFETMWTVEPAAVRDAARVCARVAGGAAPEQAAPVLYALAAQPAPGLANLGSVTSLFNRVVGYVDRFGH